MDEVPTAAAFFRTRVKNYRVLNRRAGTGERADSVTG